MAPLIHVMHYLLMLPAVGPRTFLRPEGREFREHLNQPKSRRAMFAANKRVPYQPRHLWPQLPVEGVSLIFGTRVSKPRNSKRSPGPSIDGNLLPVFPSGSRGTSRHSDDPDTARSAGWSTTTVADPGATSVNPRPSRPAARSPPAPPTGPLPAARAAPHRTAPQDQNQDPSTPNGSW